MQGMTSKILRHGYGITGLFLAFLSLTITFDRHWLPDPASFLGIPFQYLAKQVAQGMGTPYTLEYFASDSVLLYIHVLFFAAVFTLMGLVLFFFQKSPIKLPGPWLQFWLRYYLAWQLLYYGWNKVFKWQFYLPEPNLLYRTLGSMDPDILYWSVMGLSRPYNLFLGSLEVLAALMLFFRKTAFLGALLSVGILLNIVAINFTFDISVKVYSSLLLVILLYLSGPELARLWSKKWSFSELTPARYWPTWVQTLVICLLLFDSLQPYLFTGNFNDDQAERPAWHGAYALEQNTREWTRFYVHREGYLILENAAGWQRDIKGEGPGVSIFTDAAYQYSLRKSSQDTVLLWIQGPKDTFSLKATPLPWQELPALQAPFHWRVD